MVKIMMVVKLSNHNSACFSYFPLLYSRLNATLPYIFQVEIDLVLKHTEKSTDLCKNKPSNYNHVDVVCLTDLSTLSIAVTTSNDQNTKFHRKVTSIPYSLMNKSTVGPNLYGYVTPIDEPPYEDRRTFRFFLLLL